MKILYDMARFGTEFLYFMKVVCKPFFYIAYFTETNHYHEWYPIYWGLNPMFQWDLRDQGIKNEHNVRHLLLSHTSVFFSLSASADCHSHCCYLGCVGRCNGLCYLHSLSLFFWPVLSLVLSEKKTPSSPTALADGCSREEGHTGAGCNWAGTSCSPRDGCTVFLGLHTQRSYAGGLAVWINIEIIAIDSTAHPGTSKKAAHMCLSHVAASWTGYAQEVSNTTRTVRVRRHAGGDGVTRHNAARHWRCSTAAPDPRRVLDLVEKSRDYELKWV